MTIIQKQILKSYHKHRLVQTDLHQAQVQGWSSKTVQKKRFEVFCQMIEVKGASILDIGCGYGDFKHFLLSQGFQNDYIGLDLQPEFIQAAQKQFAHIPNTWFYEVDVSQCKLPQMDMVVASGSLSYRSSVPHYHEHMIQKLFAAADRALIFNMLDDEQVTSNELLVAQNRGKILQFCMSLCPEVDIKTDYLKGDFTICMRKHEYIL